MKLKLLHLYADLMNLYGEYGNIAALKRHLEDQGAQVSVIKTETAAGISFGAFDFVYIGSGTEKNMKKALVDLRKEKESFTRAVQGGTVMLLTGNAFEMLGQAVTDGTGKNYEGLCLAPFTTTEQSKKRITGDCYCVCDFLHEPLVGFINKCSDIQGVETPLFDMQMGFGNSENETLEGLHLRNLFGTHMIGPILVKNPHFMEYIVTLLCTRQNAEFVPVPKEYPYTQRAYTVTKEKLYARMQREI